MTIGEMIKLLDFFDHDVEVTCEGSSFNYAMLSRRVEYVDGEAKVIEEQVELY